MLSDDTKVGSPPSEFGVSRLARDQTREFLVVKLESVAVSVGELENLVDPFERERLAQRADGVLRDTPQRRARHNARFEPIGFVERDAAGRITAISEPM